MRFGGIEAGGTKFVCAIGSGPDDLETCEILTTTPEATIGVVKFFQAAGQSPGIGIASFGR